MSIIIVHCKLNRHYRRAILDLGIQFEITYDYPEKTPDSVLDDLDNMLSGCAFE